MRAIARCILLGAIASASFPALAEAESRGPQIVHLTIVDAETGRERRVYYHDRRYFVAGTQGRRYAIRLENMTEHRVLAIVAVDGVNVVSGTPGGLYDHGPVLAPHEVREISGWLKNDNEVAVFRFSPMAQSYATQTGRPDNVGVIGLAVFEEKGTPAPPPPPPPPPQWEGASQDQIVVTATQRTSAPSRTIAPPAPAPIVLPSEPAPALVAPPPAAKLGTAWGETATTHVTWVKFERATTTPVEVRAIEYDSLGNLIAGGVVPPDTRDEDRPDPFPDAGAERPHVPPPPVLP